MRNIITILLLFGGFHLMAQSTAGDKHFNNQEWQEAIKAYTKHLKKNSADSAALFKTAQAYLNLNQYEQALEYFQQAESSNYSVNATTLGKAQVYLAQDQNEEALATIVSGANQGASFYMTLKNDPTYDPLRDLSDYQKALSVLETNAYPCLNSEKYRHFDFWLGEWDVLVNGQKVGDNSITRANGGCAIHENYTTGTRNYTGQSINYYDPIDKKWHQHWVGSGGDVFNYLETDRADGMLQFESKFMNQQGRISLSRLTFTLNDDGTVRQFFESSTDEGKTWSPAFDGLYKKKEN
ncbi:tetratricopeptide repeat protein [Fulvivirga sp. RKSG066]|uniref:tetratricopeptide repeat protein n=1 Tax=Fulvivirga aurantia TaxID=2529383 RepID=UPI0012BB595F|nr:CDC27 family protein [Fulvivirga aurantia]MTI22559.1 tetratricopeptide repeat protein [Fulvivirga aurantia]